MDYIYPIQPVPEIIYSFYILLQSNNEVLFLKKNYVVALHFVFNCLKKQNLGKKILKNVFFIRLFKKINEYIFIGFLWSTKYTLHNNLPIKCKCYNLQCTFTKRDQLGFFL